MRSYSPFQRAHCIIFLTKEAKLYEYFQVTQRRNSDLKFVMEKTFHLTSSKSVPRNVCFKTSSSHHHMAMLKCLDKFETWSKQQQKWNELVSCFYFFQLVGKISLRRNTDDWLIVKIFGWNFTGRVLPSKSKEGKIKMVYQLCSFPFRHQLKVSIMFMSLKTESRRVFCCRIVFQPENMFKGINFSWQIFRKTKVNRISFPSTLNIDIPIIGVVLKWYINQCVPKHY